MIPPGPSREAGDRPNPAGEAGPKRESESKTTRAYKGIQFSLQSEEMAELETWSVCSTLIQILMDVQLIRLVPSIHFDQLDESLERETRWNGVQLGSTFTNIHGVEPWKRTVRFLTNMDELLGQDWGVEFHGTPAFY